MIVQEEHVSPDGRLRFRVAADPDGDLTLGFVGSDVSVGFAWHIHADILAAQLRLPAAEAVRRFVADLLGDRSVIALLGGPNITPDAWVADDPAEALAYPVGDETIELRCWRGRPWTPSSPSFETTADEPASVAGG